MRVLVACEFSGTVREAFRAKGHDAWSCDILPASDGSSFHFQCDVRDVLAMDWDMMIAHPPCTYRNLASAWALQDADFTRYPGVGYHQKVKPETLTGAARREAKRLGDEFLLMLLNYPGIERICVENPTGLHTPGLPKPSQTVQPYQFGHDASKGTCLWLRNLPPLTGTSYVPPRAVCSVCGCCEPAAVEVRERMFAKGCPECGAEAAKIRPRWANQTDSGQNRLTPSLNRWAVRSETYSGIAAAMAEQWTVNQ